EIGMVFDDVTNLVTRETCRANDVVVGSVTSITLDDDLNAHVVCRIERDVTIASNARAVLRETSLLGERYVALDPPVGELPTGAMPAGAEIPQADTRVVPDVEIVFGALSQVLNGGGLANIATISTELTTALGSSDLGATSRSFGKVIRVLDDNRSAITDSLESLNRLAGALAEQRGVIDGALDAVPDGLAVLERQRPALVRTLTALSDLSARAIPLIRRTKTDTVANLRLLGPVLEDLSRAQSDLPRLLEAVVSFPFPTYTKYVTKGDYAGMFASFSLDIDSLDTLLRDQTGQEPPVDAAEDPLAPPTLPDLTDLLSDLLPDTGVPLVDELIGRAEDDVATSLGDLLTGGAR
ncbi:MAG: MlaD family protein, partial [Nocardioides sp.]